VQELERRRTLLRLRWGNLVGLKAASRVWRAFLRLTGQSSGAKRSLLVGARTKSHFLSSLRYLVRLTGGGGGGAGCFGGLSERLSGGGAGFCSFGGV